MADPDEGEGERGRVAEDGFDLLEIPGFGLCGGLRLGKVGEDGVFFFRSEEFGRLRIVGEEEEGVDAAEDGRDAFDDEDPSRRLVSILSSMRERGDIPPACKATRSVDEGNTIGQ